MVCVTLLLETKRVDALPITWSCGFATSRQLLCGFATSRAESPLAFRALLREV